MSAGRCGSSECAIRGSAGNVIAAIAAQKRKTSWAQTDLEGEKSAQIVRRKRAGLVRR